MGLEKWVGALRGRNSRLYFLGQLTSAIGTGMTPVALSFAVLALRHASASDVGVVLAAQTVPLVVFLLIGGVAGDRFGRRHVMLAADVLRASAETALGAWILFGHPPLWGFLLLPALVGTGTAFFMPSLTGLIPQIVSSDRLTQANALNGLTFSIGSIIGPAVAGVIVAASSPGWAILADALSYALSVCSLAALRLGPLQEAASGSFLTQLRQGWHEFWCRSWLWATVTVASVSNMTTSAPFSSSAPLSRRSRWWRDPWERSSAPRAPARSSAASRRCVCDSADRWCSACSLLVRTSMLAFATAGLLGARHRDRSVLRGRGLRDLRHSMADDHAKGGTCRGAVAL